MTHIKNLCTLMLCLFFVVPQNSIANDDFEGEDLSRILEIREEDRYLVYGEFVEIEVTSTQDIELSFNNEIYPFGMEIEKTSANSFVIFGRSEFVGKLCFLVDAKSTRGKLTTERLCLYSENNEEINYPRYSSERFIDSVEVNSQFNISFSIEDHDASFFQSLASALNGALMVQRDQRGVLSVSGSLSEPGIYDFVVKTKELDSEIATYKQFVLEVKEQNRSQQCAPGYYWDDYLMYCVQASGRTCTTGTWYDSESNTCRAYRTVRSCSAGTYFDHWLNRCVRSTAMRCPMNYEWDTYYSRCVRQPYSCSYNERYDYSQRTCVRIYRSRTCSIGSHWDSYRLRCVNNSRFCRSGNYWNGYACQTNRRVCRTGRYYDPSRGRCLSRTTVRSCRPGSYWDHGRNSCSRRRVVANRTCRAGSRWSTGSGRCVSHNNGRVVRHPRRPHRPVVTRPHRPNRPTTRPDRPTRPNRPTTRPDRPTRPNRPTTRPDRPTRPNRPTTRPDRPTRPNRPTTRPDRPTRPNRPTTRPDRPSRSSGSTSGSVSRPSRSSGSSGSASRPTRPSRSSGSSSGSVSRPSRPSSGCTGSSCGSGRRRRG